MNKKISEILACRSSSELLALLRQYQVQFRTWLQENGELSFVVGLVLGLIFILFFKVLFIGLALAVIAISLWWIWLEQQKPK